MKQAVLLFILSLLVPFFGAFAGSNDDIYDGFEGTSLSDYWTTKRMVPGALVIQDKVVRKGKRAAQITVHSKDRFEDGGSKYNSTERAELSEKTEMMSLLGDSYSYAFSLFIPKDFPVVPTRLVLAQWKQECILDSCSPDNPVIALRYVGGELYITVQHDANKKTIFQMRDDLKNRWLDLKFEIHFSRKQDGFVRCWLNEKKIADYRGPTAYASNVGYPQRAKFYFKMGLYRDLMAEPMTIYIDEYRKTKNQTR